MSPRFTVQLVLSSFYRKQAENRDVRGIAAKPKVLQHIGGVRGLLAAGELQKAKRPQKDLEWQKQRKKIMKLGTFGFKSAEWNCQNKLDWEFQMTSLFLRYVHLAAYFLKLKFNFTGCGRLVRQNQPWEIVLSNFLWFNHILTSLFPWSPGRSDRFELQFGLHHIVAVWTLGPLSLQDPHFPYPESGDNIILGL